jgi:hypothetical protein
MPFVRIDLVAGKSADYRRAIGDVVYEALVDTCKAPKDDRFQAQDGASAPFGPATVQTDKKMVGLCRETRRPNAMRHAHRVDFFRC